MLSPKQESVRCMGRRQILAIDPGPDNMGVCIIEPFHTPQVTLLQEFDLKKYAPQDTVLSCFQKGSVTSLTIGACVVNMIQREPQVFGHIQELHDGTMDETSVTVVIEKQMNISTNNCCILSAFQAYYEMHGVECCILSPACLEKYYPTIFAGTKKNRPKRKTAIKNYGKRILTQEEMNIAPIGVSKEDSTKKRKRVGPSFSIHALDAMFYGMVYCKICPEIQMDIIMCRIIRDSQLKYELDKRFVTHTKKMRALEEKEKEEKKMRALEEKEKEEKKKNQKVPIKKEGAKTAPSYKRGRWRS